jgi:hypothetical protein
MWRMWRTYAAVSSIKPDAHRTKMRHAQIKPLLPVPLPISTVAVQDVRTSQNPFLPVIIPRKADLLAPFSPTDLSLADAVGGVFVGLFRVATVCCYRWLRQTPTGLRSIWWQTTKDIYPPFF